MPSKKTTTVVLTPHAQEIKDRLAPALGLKNILSVGLDLFDALSDTEKIRQVAGIGKQPTGPNLKRASKESIKDAISVIKKLTEDSGPEAEIIRLLSKDEQKIVNEIRQFLGPDLVRPKKEAKRG